MNCHLYSQLRRKFTQVATCFAEKLTERVGEEILPGGNSDGAGPFSPAATPAVISARLRRVPLATRLGYHPGMAASDGFLADCPARTPLDLVADTWSVIAIVALGRGPARYTDLQDRIGGVSKKKVTPTLSKRERKTARGTRRA